MEILAALEIKKMLVDRLVNLLSRGYVLPVVKYMAQCWGNTDTDISLIRYSLFTFQLPKFKIQCKSQYHCIPNF